jgi:CPA2 family monovalent cation:H+ antiporter-2
MPQTWVVLYDIVVLLAAALALGVLAERLKQSAIIGYLVAGALLGPNALHVISGEQIVHAIAELGVAMLLFVIGLEFSFRRLRQLGPVALIAGTAQVVLTTLVFAAGALAFGAGIATAITIGMIVAISSTACVLRVLVDRAELDSVEGRISLGILLLQDVAVVPMVLLVSEMGGGGGPGQVMFELLKAAGVAIGLVLVFALLFNVLLPRVLQAAGLRRNRDLAVLLAAVAAMGSAWISHRFDLSPALGAFLAGIMLGESPFATQIRADVSSLRVLFVTLFFAAVGMLADPLWIVVHWWQVIGLTAAVILGKTLITAALLRGARQTIGHATAAALGLAQIGEFSFVIAEIGFANGLLGEELFKLLVAVAILSLILTPYLIGFAPRLGAWMAVRLSRKTIGPTPTGDAADAEQAQPAEVIIIGLGPAGQRAAFELKDRFRLGAIDLNPRYAVFARNMNMDFQLGDATSEQVLEEAHVRLARAILVTLPNPVAARHVIEQLRHLAPQATLVARARYHVTRWELQLAGAEVVDEEEYVGERLGKHLAERLIDQPTLGSDEPRT